MSVLRPFTPLFGQTSSKNIAAFACKLVDFTANYGGTGGDWFQIFDKATAAVTDDVPIQSYKLDSTSANTIAFSMFQELAPLPMANGLSFGLSTLAQKYAASASTYDVMGDIEEYEQKVLGLTTVTNAAATGITAWAESAGPKMLYYLSVAGVFVPTSYIQMFPTDTVTASQVPIQQWRLKDIGGTTRPTPFVLQFGDGGTPCLRGTSKGCTFAVSTTSGLFTADVSTNYDWVAKYK